MMDAMVLLAALAGFQAKPPEVAVAAHPKVDQERVNQAIEKGCRWLLTQKSEFLLTFHHHRRYQPDPIQSRLDIVLLTLVHSGYTEEDPNLAELVQETMRRKIQSTYTAALQAMALQKLNARKYQWRIAQCAQFLVDNQADNGQWDYGEETRVEHYAPPPSKTQEPVQGIFATGISSPVKPSPSKAAAGATKIETKLPKLPLVRQRKGPPQGDNSNTQYAALGLRACMDAGVVIDPEVLIRGRKWFEKSQNKDGGWGYGCPDRVMTSYGSMTVGAVGALCIYDFFLGGNGRVDPAAQRGVDWLVANYDVKTNPKSGRENLYYLYGLERAGILFGTELLGQHEWYVEGAQYLLETQSGSGAWNNGMGDPVRGGAIADTCFAILFLRRATKPLAPKPEEKKPTVIYTGSPEKK